MKLRYACGLLLFAAISAYSQDAPDQQQQPPQTPPQQAPQPQQPPAAPGTPATAKPQVTLPPQPQGQPSKAPPPERDTLGDGFSIMPFYWIAPGQPRMRTASGTTATDPGDLYLNGNKRYALGATITIPTGGENSLQFTYARKISMANNTIGVEESYFGNIFAAGDTIATHYNLQYMKLSWNYLAYPYPSAGAKFRFKPLFEVQYVGIDATFDAPSDTNATTTEGRKNVILPALGAGIEYHLAKRLVFEAKATGFGLVHHQDLYDAEANLVGRMGRIEIVLGGKAFHYKTSPHGDNYFSQSLFGPYAGVRYVFK